MSTESRHVMNSSVSYGFNFQANTLASAVYPVTMFKWNDKFFFLNLKIESEHHRKFYVQMMGTEEECKKYTVEISLEDKTGKHAAMFCDNPFPIEMSEEDLNAGGMLVTNGMRKKICIPMVDRPKRLEYSVVLTFATVALED